jgi:hypothetical protein
MKIVAVLAALALSACTADSVAVRTETVTVYRTRYVTLKPEWIAPTAVPAAAPRRCTWLDAETGAATPTACLGDLTEACSATAAALESCNADKAAIRAVQPSLEQSR